MNQKGNLRRQGLIKARMFLAGKSQAEVARLAGVSRGLVCHVVAGRKRHARVRMLLADVVGMSASDLWED